MRKFWVLGVALSALASSSALAFNTYSKWDGQQYVYEFGCDGVPFGQVIKIPEGQHALGQFSFWWANRLPNPNGSSMVVRAEVYAWHKDRAVDPVLWESEPRTISYFDSDFHKETFKPGAIPVTPGEHYVLFASVDKDQQQCSNGYNLDWGAVDGIIYPKGTFVFQMIGEGDDWQSWTTQPWRIYPENDLAMKAMITP